MALSSQPAEDPAQPAANLQDVADQATTEQAPPIEVDLGPGQDNDADSALGEHVASSTVSLIESIRQYRTLHGRTYQSSRTTHYWAPKWASNDELQNDGLDAFHNAVTILLGDQLFLERSVRM